MKTFLFITWSLFAMSSCKTLANNLTVNITNIKPEKGGQLMVMVFGEQGYPKKHEQAIQMQIVKTLKPELSLEFDVPLEDVAIKVLHDEDSNGKVTKNWTGIWPKEGLGFSNNQKVSITGVPTFKASKIRLNSEVTEETIAVKYP